MRKYAFRKLDKDDFSARVRRIDPHYARTGGQTSAKGEERPFLSMIGGFFWAYLVISIAHNHDYIENSLRQGNLPQHMHVWVFGGLAALLAISGVFLLLHLGRWIMRRDAAKRNSGGLLMGALAAGVLVYTPASVYEAGLGMMDDRSRNILLAASGSVSESLSQVEFNTVAFVSSQGN